MNKKTATILVISTICLTATVVCAILFFVFQGDLFGEKPDEQRVLIETGYFNSKPEENGAIHIIKTGCKVYYKDKYKSKVDKVLDECTEDINAIMGNYFREQDVEEIMGTGYFEETELYIKDEINELLNERIARDESLPIEYVTDVVLFDTIYQ